MKEQELIRILVAQQMNEQKEELVLAEVTRFTATTAMAVDIRKPNWMPMWLYRWLWRQVVVTEGVTRIEREAEMGR